MIFNEFISHEGTWYACQVVLTSRGDKELVALDLVLGVGVVLKQVTDGEGASSHLGQLSGPRVGVDEEVSWSRVQW